MHPFAALVAACLTVQSSAFLIPPEIHDAVETVKGQLDSLFTIQKESYLLECPECPFAGGNENDPIWVQGVENKIALDFAINDNRFTINEVAIFPLDISQGPSPLTIVASQVSDNARSAPFPLGHVIEVYPEFASEAEPDKRAIAAKFTIVDLNGTPVKVDTVKVTLLKIGDQLAIVQISQIPFAESPGHDFCEGDAKWSLCRVRAIINARIQAFVAAAKSHAEKAKTWMKKPSGGCPGRNAGHRGHDGNHGRHGHHDMHRGMHHFGHVLHQAMRFFVVPALLGVIGGLMASAVGMLVGQLIVYMWFRFYRRGERNGLRLGEVVLVEEEKDGLLLEGGEAPPAYEQADEIVEDEKH